MIKEYRSRTAISVSGVLPSGKGVHVSFAAQSDGSSVYVTGNADIQYALEHHYRYGKLFRLAESRDEDGAAGSDGHPNLRQCLEPSGLDSTKATKKGD